MSRKLTNEEIVQKIYELVRDEYTKLDDTYINNKAKFKMRHNVCGHVYMVNWHNFQQGSRCPKCTGCYRYTDNEISELISEMTNGEYTKLSEYKDNKTKFRIKHVACGHEYMVCWGNFQQGQRCPKCNGKHRYTDNEIDKLVADMTNGEYTKLSEYKNNHTKFKIKHNKCNFEYEVRWNDFQKGVRCPKCNQSKGEKFIEDYLTNQGISFATQIKFDDCRHKLPLPFDFAIMDDNRRIVALIEFDGEQHYKSVDFFGGEETLKQTQLRDSIKNEYCQDNGIPLLRIKYNEQNMLKVIEEFIAQERVKV